MPAVDDPGLQKSLDQAALMSAQQQVAALSPDGQRGVYGVWRNSPGGAEAFDGEAKSKVLPLAIGAAVGGLVVGAGLVLIFKGR